MIPKTQWTVTPRNTMIVVLTQPDGAMTTEAIQWLYRRFPFKNVATLKLKGLLPARNRSIRDIVLKSPAHFTDFILMDRDVRPSHLSDPFLCLPQDIAGCKYNTGEHNNLHWHLPDAFHLGLCRIRRKVFETIPAPWFDMPITKDGCAYEYCECVSLHIKAVMAGFTIAHAGWADHESGGSWAH